MKKIRVDQGKSPATPLMVVDGSNDSTTQRACVSVSSELYMQNNFKLVRRRLRNRIRENASWSLPTLKIHIKAKDLMQSLLPRPLKRTRNRKCVTIPFWGRTRLPRKLQEPKILFVGDFLQNSNHSRTSWLQLNSFERWFNSLNESFSLFAILPYQQTQSHFHVGESSFENEISLFKKSLHLRFPLTTRVAHPGCRRVT